MLLVLNVSRVIILCTFILSLVGKLQNIKTFQNTIFSFAIIPSWATGFFSYLVIFAETIVVILMFSQGKLLSLGFSMGSFLLFIFTVALVAVLIRKINTPCNCFGASTAPVSQYDVIRNVVFIIISILGIYLSRILYDNTNTATLVLATIIS